MAIWIFIKISDKYGLFVFNKFPQRNLIPHPYHKSNQKWGILPQDQAGIKPGIKPDEMAKFWIKIRQPFRKTVFFFRDNITARSRLIKSTAKFRLVYILNDVFYYIIDLMKTSPWRWWLTSWWRTTLLPGLRYCACPTITPHSYRYPVIPAKFPVATR